MVKTALQGAIAMAKLSADKLRRSKQKEADKDYILLFGEKSTHFQTVLGESYII